METKLVENSSQVKEIGYDKEKLIFKVVYKNDATYHYFNVPEELWEKAKVAESVGKFVAAFIKPHTFKKLA